MTDIMDTEQHTEALTGRKLNLALSALLVEGMDEVDRRFPNNGNPATAEYVANYEAHRSLTAALNATLTALPADPAFRAYVYELLGRGAGMTGFQPQSDEVVRKCIARAADDYRPDTPDELKRSSTPKKAAAPTKAASK